MRHHSTICCFLMCILFAQSLPAQTGSWNAVMSIPSGTILIVRISRGSVHCTLASVTVSELMCYREPGKSGGKTRNYTISRSEIIQLRRESRSGLKKAVGAGIGALVGIGIGIAADPKAAQAGGPGPAVGALYGTIVGLIAGLIVSTRGVVVYQR